MNRLLSIFLMSLVGVVVASNAYASTLSLIPEGKVFGIGAEFKVDVIINSENESINAGQATIRFPNDKLELISTDRAGSAFKFWVEEPEISNEDGFLRFIGGTSKGISGESLKVLTMNFKTRGAGSATLVISDGVVTASDGKGTNVLSKTEGVSIGVGTEVVIPEGVEIVSELPKKIEREAILAKDLPDLPIIRVPLYPQESKWYSHIGDVIALWDLPPDVVQVSTRLSRIKDKVRGEKEEDLFNGKSFGILEEEGRWYIRVQFRNNIGWSELAYYEIALDTTAPLPFEIEIDSASSQNPSPFIRYATSDSLSGIKEYVIVIDGEEVLRTVSSTVAIPVQKPGSHNIKVRALDEAGNSVEDDIEFEVIPLPSPKISFVSKIVSQEDILFIFGSTVPDASVFVNIKNNKGKSAFEGVAKSDASGNYSISVEELFPTGDYNVSVYAKDLRGALSLDSDLEYFRVKAKTVISLGFLDLSWFEILMILVILGVSISGTIAWHYASIKKTSDAYRIIAARDIEKFCVLLEDEVSNINQSIGSAEMSPKFKTELEVRVGKVGSVVLRIKKYINQELKKIT